MEDYNDELLDNYMNDEDSYNGNTLEDPISEPSFEEETINKKDDSEEKLSLFQERNIKKIGGKDMTPKLKNTHNPSKSELRLNRRINK